jgi:hypothetical protein
MILCEWDAPEGDPGQSCVHLYARILSSSLTSVSIFSVSCYSIVSISMGGSYCLPSQGLLSCQLLSSSDVGKQCTNCTQTTVITLNRHGNRGPHAISVDMITMIRHIYLIHREMKNKIVCHNTTTYIILKLYIQQ